MKDRNNIQRDEQIDRLVHEVKELRGFIQRGVKVRGEDEPERKFPRKGRLVRVISGNNPYTVEFVKWDKGTQTFTGTGITRDMVRNPNEPEGSGTMASTNGSGPGGEGGQVTTMTRQGGQDTITENKPVNVRISSGSNPYQGIAQFWNPDTNQWEDSPGEPIENIYNEFENAGVGILSEVKQDFSTLMMADAGGRPAVKSPPPRKICACGEIKVISKKINTSVPSTDYAIEPSPPNLIKHESRSVVLDDNYRVIFDFDLSAFPEGSLPMDDAVLTFRIVHRRTAPGAPVYGFKVYVADITSIAADQPTYDGLIAGPLMSDWEEGAFNVPRIVSVKVPLDWASFAAGQHLYIGIRGYIEETFSGNEEVDEIGFADAKLCVTIQAPGQITTTPSQEGGLTSSYDSSSTETTYDFGSFQVYSGCENNAYPILYRNDAWARVRLPQEYADQNVDVKIVLPVSYLSIDDPTHAATTAAWVLNTPFGADGIQNGDLADWNQLHSGGGANVPTMPVQDGDAFVFHLPGVQLDSNGAFEFGMSMGAMAPDATYQNGMSLYDLKVIATAMPKGPCAP